MPKPHASACDRNQKPILQVLKSLVLPKHRKLLEIGSGTGQHAVYLAPHFPQLEWITSDVAAQHLAIQAWLTEAKISNISGPLELEVGAQAFPANQFDWLFTANTLHIMSWPNVLTLLGMICSHCTQGTELLFYGPFNYEGKFTSESNQIFNDWLQNRDKASGIRSFEAICTELGKGDFELINDYAMPANNRCLHFRRN